MKYKPEGQNSLISMIAVNDPEEAIAWYKKVFDAEELFRLTMPDSSIVHAEIRIDDTILSMAGADPNFNETPESLGGSTVILSLNVADCDDVFNQALKSGAEEVIPVKDQFYGYRSGRIRDPFGHIWIISTMKEELSPEEMQRRMMGVD
jgi:PhnB protein